MNYATGEQPQVGDRVTFLRVNGQPKEGVVTKVGMSGLFVQIASPSTRRWARGGKTFVSGIVPLVDLVGRGPFDVIFGDVLDRQLLAARKEDLHAAAGPHTVQEVVLNMIDADGVRQERVMNMAAGVNSVVLSGRIDTDLEDPSAFHLQMFPGLDFWVAEGLAADIQANDEVIVMGTLKSYDAKPAVVFVEQVVKVAD